MPTISVDVQRGGIPMSEGAFVVLVDFGNTLVDQNFMWRDTERFPDWSSHWSEVMATLGSAWERGEVRTETVIAQMASRLECSAVAVSEHIDTLCREIVFYPKINGALVRRRARGERQAIVTVNPDAFQAVADLYGLSETFDLIVTSAELGSVDKREICAAACERLGVVCPQTILIDNLEENVQAWRQHGGQGYVFVDDEEFADDVRTGRIAGFDLSDLDQAPGADG